MKENDTVKISSESRDKYGKMSGIIGIVCNLILFAGKFISGLISGSVAISADAVNSLSDASSSLISLLGFKMSEKPADEEHPYGHGRYEYLSGLLVCVLILVIGVELFKGSIEKIIKPELITLNPLIIVILSVSMAVKFGLALVNYRLGKKIGSLTLLATAADSRNDIITTGAVLIASIVSNIFEIAWLDGVMGLCVAIFILISGFGLLKDTLNPLLGSAPDEALVKEIHDAVMSYNGVLGTHDLMIHDYGPGRQFASVHVEMAAEADVLESHETIDLIEHDLGQKLGIHIVIHLDPIVTDENTNSLRRWLSEEVKAIDPLLTIHDLRVVPGKNRTNIIFDCVKPYQLEDKLSDRELKEKICEIVASENPAFCCVITIDRSFASVPAK